jgi:hypothetical protein
VDRSNGLFVQCRKHGGGGVVTSLHELTFIPQLVHDTTGCSHLLFRGHTIRIPLYKFDSLLVAVVRDEEQDMPSDRTRKQPPLAVATTRLVVRQVIGIDRRQPLLFGHLLHSDHHHYGEAITAPWSSAWPGYR